MLHHQNLGSELGHHLVLCLSNPHLLGTQVKSLKPQALQNLVKLFQMLIIQLQAETLLPGLYLHGLGSKTMETTIGGYGSNLNYNSGFGSGMHSSYGGFGSSYGGGLYGNNSMYGGGGYGRLYGGFGMYGGSMYSSGFGGTMRGYGMGIVGPYGNQDPNNPYGAPPSPPGFWCPFFGCFTNLMADAWCCKFLWSDLNPHRSEHPGLSLLHVSPPSAF